MTAPSHPLSYQALTAGLLGGAYLQRALAAGAGKKEEYQRLLNLGEAERWQKQALG